MVWNGNDRGKRWSRFNTDTRYAICAFNEFNKHRKRVATTEPNRGKREGRGRREGVERDFKRAVRRWWLPPPFRVFDPAAFINRNGYIIAPCVPIVAMK